MNQNQEAERKSVSKGLNARAILPGLIWIAILIVTVTLAKGLLFKGHFLLSACTICIGFAGAPLLLRWALVRVHGEWSRVSRGDRIAVYVGDALVLIGIVTMFVMAYIRTQQLADDNGPQDMVWRW